MFVPFPEFNPGNDTRGDIVATATTATIVAAQVREEPAVASAREPSLGFNPKDNARRKNAATATAATNAR